MVAYLQIGSNLKQVPYIYLYRLSLSFTIISINNLKKIYGETDDSSRIAHPHENLDEVLIKRFENERNRHLAKCENSRK